MDQFAPIRHARHSRVPPGVEQSANAFHTPLLIAHHRQRVSKQIMTGFVFASRSRPSGQHALQRGTIAAANSRRHLPQRRIVKITHAGFGLLEAPLLVDLHDRTRNEADDQIPEDAAIAITPDRDCFFAKTYTMPPAAINTMNTNATAK